MKSADNASNPWLDIPLSDYEGHMSLPEIGQAEILAKELAQLVGRKRPASVAVIGCAGGNGFDALCEVQRVVAVDINAHYLDETARRYASRIRSLETCCVDVQSNALRFEPVALIHAALIFEYVDVAAALASLKRICAADGTLAAILQLPRVNQPSVSSSPYVSLQKLGPVMRLVPPSELIRCAVAAGFVAEDGAVITLSSGKSFWSQTFRA
jgi:hypothetical protein